ncbi:YheT family hydrolase [Planctomicrobium piriforme]|uniref:YheT family hydrolase n=1 Tax=Planctomicrobium piriforme TaxID=1576369 RepID=UPI001587545E|nr:alpha/beta fold hydrolase [Planctomicrobium piriforme]
MSSQRSSTDIPLSEDLFSPPVFFRNGHVQTLAGMYVYSPWAGRERSSFGVSLSGEVLLSDDDRLVYQDDRPKNWQSGDRVALLLHGLGGSHASHYMSRIARLLNQHNVRAFRLDWRGCGAGVTLARYPYHSGRSSDLAATLAEIQARCPGSPITVIGFSLGGNVTLKLLGETQNSLGSFAAIDRAVAVCPPIDLNMTVTSLGKGWSQLYDRYFCKACTRDVRNRQRQRPDAIIPDGWFSRLPRTLYEFDETFTAPVSGFESAAEYYARSSANQFLAAITVPTLVIAAQDDPLIPFAQFKAADYSAATKLLAPQHGGHLGFCTPRGLGWLDRQILNWTLGPHCPGR